MLSTSTGNYISRVSLNPSDAPLTASCLIAGMGVIVATSASNTFLIGPGLNSSNYLCMRLPANTTGPNALVRVGGTTDFATAAHANIGVGNWFFFGLRKAADTLSLRIGGTTLSVACPAGGFTPTDVSVGAVKTGGSYGATTSMRWRDVLWLEDAGSDAELDHLWNNGAPSHALFRDFARANRNRVYWYGDLGPDWGRRFAGRLSHMSAVGSPTADPDDEASFPGLGRFAYLPRTAYSKHRAFVWGTTFEGNLAMGSGGEGIRTLGSDGLPSATESLITPGTAADAAVDLTSTPSNMALVDGGVFARNALWLRGNHDAYLRCLHADLPPALQVGSTQHTIVAFVSPLAGGGVNQCIFGNWSEFYAGRVISLWRNLLQQTRFGGHGSGSGGPTPPFEFNYDIALSGQVVLDRVNTMAAMSFRGFGDDTGELRVFVDGVFSALDPVGTPVQRGNPQDVAFDELWEPADPTEAAEKRVGWYIGSVPTKVTDPGPATLANQFSGLIHALLVFDEALSEFDLQRLQQGLDPLYEYEAAATLGLPAPMVRVALDGAVAEPVEIWLQREGQPAPTPLSTGILIDPDSGLVTLRGPGGPGAGGIAAVWARTRSGASPGTLSVVGSF